MGIMRDRIELSTRRLTKYSQNEFCFNIDKITPEMAYFAGWLCADGSLVAKRGVAFEISTLDEIILENFKAYTEFTGPITRRIRNGNVAMSKIHVVSGQWISDLARWGIVKRKSRVGSDISNVIKTPYFHLFFRGLFDGDGCLHIRKNNYAYLSLAGRPEVVDTFRCWMWNEDRNAGSLSCRSDITHVVQYGSISAAMIVKRIYDGTFEELNLKRKRDIAQKIVETNGGKINLATRPETVATVRYKDIF